MHGRVTCSPNDGHVVVYLFTHHPWDTVTSQLSTTPTSHEHGVPKVSRSFTTCQWSWRCNLSCCIGTPLRTSSTILNAAVKLSCQDPTSRYCHRDRGLERSSH